MGKLMNAFAKVLSLAFPVQGRRCFEGLTFNGHDYKAERNLKIPTHTMPLRVGEDEVVRGAVEGEERDVFPDGIARMRAEERAKALQLEQEFVNRLHEVLS